MKLGCKSIRGSRLCYAFTARYTFSIEVNATRNLNIPGSEHIISLVVTAGIMHLVRSPPSPVLLARLLQSRLPLLSFLLCQQPLSGLLVRLILFETRFCGGSTAGSVLHSQLDFCGNVLRNQGALYLFVPLPHDLWILDGFRFLWRRRSRRRFPILTLTLRLAHFPPLGPVLSELSLPLISPRCLEPEIVPPISVVRNP